MADLRFIASRAFRPGCTHTITGESYPFIVKRETRSLAVQTCQMIRQFAAPGRCCVWVEDLYKPATARG